MAKTEWWLPWTYQIGPSAETSTAIGTWWLVLVSFVAAVVTAFGVFTAFWVQVRQFRF